MPVKHYNSQQLDFFQWDNFIESSGQPSIYALSWYLQAVGRPWAAFVQTNSAGEILAALPYQKASKYGISKVEQEPFTNELGVFSIKADFNPKELIAALRQKLFVSAYVFNSDNQQAIFSSFSKQFTFHLNLNKPYPELASQYSNHHVRNIKKARQHAKEEGFLLGIDNSIEGLITLFQHNVANRIYNVTDVQYATLRRLYHEFTARQLGHIYAVRTPEGELLSAALVVKSFNKLVYYFAASCTQARVYNCQVFLLDELIKEHSGQHIILDFEGGNEPGLNRFYAGFGAQEASIYTYRSMGGQGILNALNWLLRL